MDRPFRRDCHPVEVEYPEDPQRFRPAVQGEQGSLLTFGKVTCTSCHSGSSPGDSYLNIEPATGQLCLRCHDK